jgi:hypothetical protein
VIKTCYNNGQKERLCLIIDKCRRQKLCKGAQKILAVRPQGLKNPLARRLGLVISTFGLAEIISCMPDGLVKKYISDISSNNKTLNAQIVRPEMTKFKIFTEKIFILWKLHSKILVGDKNLL